jgi:hypothetical protein
MKKSDHVVFGIHVTDRVKHARDLQKVFTEFGCHIKTRLGLHEVSEKTCGPNGLIILEVCGKAKVLGKMEKAVAGVDGVQIQKMVFGHGE